MDRNVKRSRRMIIVLVILYAVSVVCLFWFHPFVASAAETDTPKKNVPGGNGNAARVIETLQYGNSTKKEISDRTFILKDNVEMVGYINTFSGSDGTVSTQLLTFIFIRDGKVLNLSPSDLFKDYVGVKLTYTDGILSSSTSYNEDDIDQPAKYYYNPNFHAGATVECTVTGMKVFKDKDALDVYVENGSLDGMIKEELDSSWYLKDIRCEVFADDSPSGSGGEEATYIKFFWLTDNLEDGDLIEVKTWNYVKKIGGDKISGFHDYITWHNNISALDNLFNFTDKNGETSERASWTIGQKDAVKTWFASLENKPFIFKTYETEIYYFRPVRDGKFGKWCKVTMNRFGDSGSPYIEDVEIGDMDDEGDWDRDDDLTDENGGNHGVDQGGDITTPDPDNPFEGTNIAGIFSYIFDFFKSIPSLLGDLPALVNSILGFLPLPIIGFIAAGILIAIALRIVGR